MASVMTPTQSEDYTADKTMTDLPPKIGKKKKTRCSHCKISVGVIGECLLGWFGVKLSLFSWHCDATMPLLMFDFHFRHLHQSIMHHSSFSSLFPSIYSSIHPSLSLSSNLLTFPLSLISPFSYIYVISFLTTCISLFQPNYDHFFNHD